MNTTDNNLFATAASASAAAKQWQANDIKSLDKARAAVEYCLTVFAMHKDPNQANAQPLTHWCMAFEHRGKGGLATKLRGWIEAVSPYKWYKGTKTNPTERFALKRDGKVSNGLNAEALQACPHFDKYTKKTAKKPFDLAKSLDSLVKKAAKNDYTPVQIATETGRYAQTGTVKIIKATGGGKAKAPKVTNTMTEAQQNEAQAEQAMTVEPVIVEVPQEVAA